MKILLLHACIFFCLNKKEHVHMPLVQTEVCGMQQNQPSHHQTLAMSNVTSEWLSKQSECRDNGNQKHISVGLG